ncbi:hypothetical protein G7054_g14225 [Neopestalotiopsis clavispora]|nr:hypothetical protein G7054_g14225 [Neopestalotiopsis clavispora]
MSSSPPLVRLRGIPLSRLPPSDASPDVLTPFIHDILREALPFLYTASIEDDGAYGPDSELWKHKGDKTSPDSTAPVEAWERTLQVQGAGGAKEKETWALRRSVHEDRGIPGTANWAEFEMCFRREHAEAEEAFTPNVQATHEALVWDCAGVPEYLGEGIDDEDHLIVKPGTAWADFSLKVEEMRHKVGRPVLKDRTFPVLQLTAGLTTNTAGEKHHVPDFIVVSIPVPDFGASAEFSRLSSEKGAQVALYVSVERVRKLQNKEGRIEWIMATASDAGGVLPQFVQNLAMPGIVWKDVPLFLGWIAKERKNRNVARDGVTGKHNGGGESTAATTSTTTAAAANNDDAAPVVTTGTAVETAPKESTAEV